MVATDSIPRARAVVHTRKGTSLLNICLIFGADAIEQDVAQVAGVPATSLRVFPSEEAVRQGSYAAPLSAFSDRLRQQAERPQRENLAAAQYSFDNDILVFHVAAPVKGGGARRPRQPSTQQQSSAYSTVCAGASRYRASSAQVKMLWEVISKVWPRDERGVLLPSREGEDGGVVLAPRWALVHARAEFLRNSPAGNDETTPEDGEKTSIDISRYAP